MVAVAVAAVTAVPVAAAVAVLLPVEAAVLLREPAVVPAAPGAALAAAPVGPEVRPVGDRPEEAAVAVGVGPVGDRAVDPDRSLPWLPCHPCGRFAPVRPGQILPLDIELHPSATLFRRGEQLLLDIQGRWFFPTNPVLGQFPARYERSDRGTCVLHMGGQHDAALHLPQR